MVNLQIKAAECHNWLR